MKTRSFLRVLLPTLFALPLAIPNAPAEEAGSGHYFPGTTSTLIDLPPTRPGWIFEAINLNYQGDVSAARILPVGGLATGGLSASSDAVSIGGFYTFENKILGSYYSIGAFAAYVWMDIDANVVSSKVAGWRSDHNDGFGDILLLPAIMAWKLDCWQLSAIMSVYAPTGQYDAGRLANLGLNHWTFDPTFGAAYTNEKSGFNFATYAGFSFSTENNATNYKNGVVFHLDTSVQQLLPLGPGFLGLGLEAFYREQITGDSGRGAMLGDFEDRTVGLGPVLSYVLPVHDSNLVAEVRWLTQVDAHNMLKGDYFWFKLVYQF